MDTREVEEWFCDVIDIKELGAGRFCCGVTAPGDGARY